MCLLKYHICRVLMFNVVFLADGLDRNCIKYDRLVVCNVVGCKKVLECSQIGSKE